MNEDNRTEYKIDSKSNPLIGYQRSSVGYNCLVTRFPDGSRVMSFSVGGL